MIETHLVGEALLTIAATLLALKAVLWAADASPARHTRPRIAAMVTARRSDRPLGAG